MKNLLISSILLASASLSSQAQYTFSFDDEVDAIPSTWVVDGGTLSLTDEHYTDGTHSLQWEVPAGQKSSILISLTSFTPSSLYAGVFNIYSFKATDSPLKVEYLSASKNTQLTADVTINFKGWREYGRKYRTDFTDKSQKEISYIRLTLDNSGNSEAQRLCFDSVDFRMSNYSRAQVQELMVNDLKSYSSGVELLTLYAFEHDIKAEEATAQEIADIEKICSTFTYKPTAVPPTIGIASVKKYINAFNIVRNSDGTVKGNPIYATGKALTSDDFKTLVNYLNYIAASSTNVELFNLFLDHVIDQGVLYRFPQLPSNTYNIVREYPALLLNIIPKCNEEQAKEILKAAAWISEANWAFASEEHLGTEFSCDIIYNYLTHFVAVAALNPDKNVAAAELKGLSRFLERVLNPVRGGYDTIKPDWTGFHHGTHYNNYMYCFNGWTDCANLLKGTSFRISRQGYENMKHAVLAKYTMSNRSNTGVNIYANSLAGRHPLDGGQVNQFKKNYFESLIAIGADVLGAEDPELTAAYNYFLLSDKYDAPEADYKGFYQFNYSPIGVYRGDDWVVTMRAPTTRVWGAEIYSGTSRFSRYQSHGTMEVTYNGSILNSGLPSGPKGYDWNMCPGGTTVHFTNWQEMMPNKTTTDRFDQFTKTKDFSGALAWGDCGMWACDFDQIDTWGNERFTPTNLEFKKSVYAFDGMLISVGSNIKSSGSYGDDRLTATNLFQEVGVSAPLKINGADMNNGDNDMTITSTNRAWMLTPIGTGYYVPKGNNDVIVKYGEQEGPDQSGSDYANPTKAVAAKAFINHGSKASNASYNFVMVPKATAERMSEIAENVGDDGGSVYSILSQNDKFHALTYKPKGVTAYAFYGAVADTNLPTVKATGSEMLLMHRSDDNGALHIAVCNPNQRIKSISTALGDWEAQDTETSITLDGEWYTDQVTPGLTVREPENGKTVIDLVLGDGLPMYISVGPKGYSVSGILDVVEEGEWVSVSRVGESLNVALAQPMARNTDVAVYTIEGRMVANTSIAKGATECNINAGGLSSATILRITCGDKVKTVKCFK